MNEIELETAPGAKLDSPSTNGGMDSDPRPRPRRGRPPLMDRETVKERIRRLARRPEGLFRVDHTHPDLYARARRFYGSWSAAVMAAGLDYAAALGAARERARRNRARRSRRIARAGG